MYIYIYIYIHSSEHTYIHMTQMTRFLAETIKTIFKNLKHVLLTVFKEYIFVLT